MCKQYHYESICSISSCDTVLGRRHRNKWCSEALRARRLGKCTTGVENQKTIFETTRARCSKCKEELLPPRRTRTEGKTGENTGSSSTGAPKPPRQRKARSSAPKKANKRARDEEEGEAEETEKKRPKVWTCMVVANNANKEPLEVESPTGKVDNVNERAFSEEEEGPEEKPVEAEPPIEEAKPTNKRPRSEEGEEGDEPEKKRPRVESPIDEVDNAYKGEFNEEDEGPKEKPIEAEPPVEEAEPPIEAKPANKRSLSEEGEEPEKKRLRVESPTDEAREDRNVQDTTVDQASSGDEGCLPTPAPSPQHR
ncbi:hypothetical protein F5X96DRAFT_686855 [Biscogniauxia mediterranea]|nr:hypothetical protein F5X96DRAFT_686855 [Biscogniauxia mediterranea]